MAETLAIAAMIAGNGWFNQAPAVRITAGHERQSPVADMQSLGLGSQHRDGRRLTAVAHDGVPDHGTKRLFRNLHRDSLNR